MHKAKADAPNYRDAGPASTQICPTCKYASGQTCTLYDFTFREDYTCDSWLPNIEALKNRMRGLREQEMSKANRSSFKVFKDAAGDYRWLSISSTAFRDRDGEIVSTAALEKAVDTADETGERGPLRWWHMKGVDIGQCDYQMVHGRMLIESGTFHNEVIAQKVAEKADQLGLSIGFKHPKTEPDGSGVFHNISIFERSLTPAGRESNLFTSLSVKGDSMSNQLVKISGLVHLLGEEQAVDILEKAAATQKQAEENGHAYKAQGEETKDLSQMTADEIIAYGQSLKEAEAAKAKADADKAAEGQPAASVDIQALAVVIKETVDAAVDAAFKARDELAATAVKAQDATKATVDQLKAEIAALKGEQPRVMGTYRASQAESTVVKETGADDAPKDELVEQWKETHPELLPLAGVAKQFSQPFAPHNYYSPPPAPTNGGQ